MEINEFVFQHFCGTSANPIGYGILKYIEAQIESAKGVLKALIGTAVYDDIPDIDFSDKGVIAAPDALSNAAYKFVCNLAFYEAIPQLDLTLSPTGFGVVSNQNVAPASADRVDRLRRQISNQYDDAYDTILDCLRGDERWCNTDVAKRAFVMMLWRGKEMSAFGIYMPHRSDLVAKQRSISRAVIDLQNLVGNDFYFELVDAIRLAQISSIQREAVTLCINYIAQACSAMDGDISNALAKAKLRLLGFLDDNIDDFQSYKESSAYEANHYQKYANKKDDPCYFFG